ncbi:MAG: hypothetical protein HQL52_00540 [Magnetococcales bacterium]|nr:hypothetical protein [Magnetococcales bacterium]
MPSIFCFLFFSTLSFSLLPLAEVQSRSLYQCLDAQGNGVLQQSPCTTLPPIKGWRYQESGPGFGGGKGDGPRLKKGQEIDLVQATVTLASDDMLKVAFAYIQTAWDQGVHWQGGSVEAECWLHLMPTPVPVGETPDRIGARIAVKKQSLKRSNQALYLEIPNLRATQQAENLVVLCAVRVGDVVYRSTHLTPRYPIPLPKPLPEVEGGADVEPARESEPDTAD